MLQRRMMRGKFGYREAGPTVPKSAFEKETSNECCRARHRLLNSRGTLAITIHLLRSQRGIAFFDHLPMMRWISHRIMKQIAAERFNAHSFIHNNRFVDNTIAPATSLAIEEAKLIVRIPTATANPTVHIERTPRDPITIGKSGLILRTDEIN